MKNKKWMIILAIVIVVIVCVCFGILLANGTIGADKKDENEPLPGTAVNEEVIPNPLDESSESQEADASGTQDEEASSGNQDDTSSDSENQGGTASSDDQKETTSSENQNDSSDSENQTGTSDSDKEDSKPDNSPTGTTDYEKYNAMSGDEQAAFCESFESMAAFVEWYNNAKAEYEAKNPALDVGDGVVDLGQASGE